MCDAVRSLGEETLEFKPRKIGKYFLLELVASGGMAEVYRGKLLGASGFEKEVAVKRVLESYAKSEEFRVMFEHEARLCSSLSHSNIVQIFDFTQYKDTYLLAMEFVRGKNIREFVTKAKKLEYEVPFVLAVYVINEACKGLDYAHKKQDDTTGDPLNIIHRDMSPQNIMVTYEGAVKLVDFGIAKAKDQFQETRTGVIKGKYGYMSPEQAEGHAVDLRTDLFSTAIILFELLSGERLFAGETEMEILRKVHDCHVPKLSELNPEVPPELEAIVEKALQKWPEDRYQDAGEFHLKLQQFLNKYAPSFTQRDVGQIIKTVFSEEIKEEAERKLQDSDIAIMEDESIDTDLSYSYGGTRKKKRAAGTGVKELQKIKIQTVMSFVFVLLVIVGTVYLYVVSSRDRIPGINESREIAVKKAKRPGLKKRTGGDEQMDALEKLTEKIAGSVCTLQINSYPRGAKVFINGKEKGITPDILTVPCKKSIDIMLKRRDYEDLKKTMVVRKRELRVFYNLRRKRK